jgi:type IV pilus assembly protein PilF
MNASRSIVLLVTCWLLHACVTTSGQRPATDQEAAQANVNLGVGYLRQGRPDLAVERLERAISQDPRSGIAHSTIAVAYDQLGRVEEAETHYQRATQLQPNDPSSANNYAVFLCRQSRWREAESYFRRAADNPRYATPEAALANAGGCARNAGDLIKAEQYLRAALDRDPRFADALEGMVELSYHNENYLQARAFLQRHREVQRANAALLWLCYQVEQELDNPAAAQRCGRQLREDFPDSAEVAQLNRLLDSNARE